MKVEEYRGYGIWENTKTIEHHNPISGHYWTTQKIIKGCFG